MSPRLINVASLCHGYAATDRSARLCACGFMSADYSEGQPQCSVRSSIHISHEQLQKISFSALKLNKNQRWTCLTT